MSCRRVSGWMPLAVGRDLPSADQRAFEQHLQSCLRCYREYQRFRVELDRLDPLRAPGDARAPDGLFDEILAAVRTGKEGPAAAPLPRRPRPSWVDVARGARRGLPMAAGFLLCVFAGYQILGTGGRSPSPQGPTVSPALVVPVSTQRRPFESLGMPDFQQLIDSPMGPQIVPALRKDTGPSYEEPDLPRVQPVPPARVNRATRDF